MSFASPFPPVEIPDVTVFDYLFGSISKHELERVALVDGSSGTVTTYRNLIDDIEAIAGALATRGVGAGVVVGLLAPNIPAFASVLHGILRSGGTTTPVNILYTAQDIAKQLSGAGALLLITVSSLLPQAKVAAEAVGISRDRLIVIDGADGHPSLADLLADGMPAPQLSIDPARHVAVLPFSSGTTGLPKGVSLTHRNLVANIAQIETRFGITPHDILLAVLPFFHIYGLTVLLNVALKRRARLVTMAKFDLTECLRITETYKLTYLFIAPPIAVALAKHPAIERHDLSSIHTVFSGAAPLDEELGRAVARRLKVRVRQGYGMSELSPVSHVIPFDRDDIPLNSVGLPIANTHNKLVDPQTGQEIARPLSGMSQPGELWVKGPNVMAGYLNNPDATSEILDADGYLHTGDVATVDCDGAVYIVDRLKELIKYKGYQVPPAELEALLLTHPCIADAAVIGVTEADSVEEIPKAFVVVQLGARISEAEIISFVAERVAPHKRVRVVEFIERVPKSASGKILRKDLRARER
ncbi:4-coumarate--CoA ligase family protein [Mesorhizobium sp. CU2]|uniref:AMP-binding protein n=1 Tax=unclassified Mesorhizobium TaxID=325217 RepID=UPI00112E305C|nr:MULTISPECIES: AMP-binding protein [unclassified Mesorhizobium]TPN81095.1 4-coumarate--CoA ligase family protein [Mesorhizobium sp. CU3]TPO11684.1 4-coumarate--CoA ligase family protein [Mesorhizobium sp. CU2]